MNKLLKCLAFDGQISVSVLDTTKMVNDAIEKHKLSPVCAAAMGRTMTACTFMASGLKNKGDKLTVVIKGDGPCGKITVCGNGDLQMRGSVDNPIVDIPLRADGKLDVGGCVGKNGKMVVIRSMGLKESYTGSSELVSGEIAEDFTAYYALSEQQPTAMALGVLIDKDLSCKGAGGVIVQAMPFASDESLIKAEEIVKNLKNISSLIAEKGALAVLEENFGKCEYTEYEPKYECLCSREYIEEILVSLGKDELLGIIEEQGKVEVKCQFCEKNYEFYKEDVEKLF